ADPIRHFPGPHIAADIGCQFLLADRCADGIFDLSRLAAVAKMFQHQGCTKNRAYWICNVFPCQWWSRSMQRLEHGCISRTDSPARRRPESALERSGQ